MNFIPCLAWVEKGKAKSCPDKLQLSADELKNLIEENKNSKKNYGINEESASDGWETESDVSENDDVEENDEEEPDDDESKDKPTKGDEPSSEEDSTKDEDDIDAKYNMDDYDNDDDDRPLLNISDVATFVDNKEDNYITDLDAVNQDEQEEDEDYIIKASDNLLVTGHIEEESSILEIHVYNKAEDDFYIHHDIVLPAYPLALEWLDYHPSDDAPGNYIAVGDMTPVIKIWDLDVVEVLEPDYCLGEKLKSKKKDGEKKKLKCHKDAVISLSWNKQLRNLLASGSADSTIIIWDLQEGTALFQLKFHTNKVQSLQWHPFESSFLLSSCIDGLIKVYDCRAPDAECKSWSVDGEIEKVTWNLHDSLKFFCSTENGFVHSFDLKNTEAEHSVKAHSDGVTSLDMCRQHPNVLLTASMDKTLKVWDITNGFKLINSQKLKVGSIYTAKFAPDSELPVAVGGNNSSNHLKIVDLAGILGTSTTETKESSQSFKTKLKTAKKAKTEDPRLPKRIKLEKSSPIKVKLEIPSPKKVKLEKPSPKKVKLEKPSQKKIKIEKPSTSQNLNFNGPSSKTFQDKQSAPQQSVKRIHKKYT